MGIISLDSLTALFQVLLVDIVLAGDNAIVIAMATVGLKKEQRAKAMILGILFATFMRIFFASITVQLLQITGLLFIGGLLLLWVSWKLGSDLRKHHTGDNSTGNIVSKERAQDKKTMKQAIFQIIIADISMSLDNVLAVAGIAREEIWILVVGLALSVAFMGLAASLIAKLIFRHKWIAYLGAIIIFYVSCQMILEGSKELIDIL